MCNQILSGNRLVAWWLLLDETEAEVGRRNREVEGAVFYLGGGLMGVLSRVFVSISKLHFLL